MPSKSKAQQRLMGMVHAYQAGKLDDASPSIRKIANSMSPKDAKDFAKTKHKGLPNKVRRKKVKESRIFDFETFVNENYEIKNKSSKPIIDTLFGGTVSIRNYEKFGTPRKEITITNPQIGNDTFQKLVMYNDGSIVLYDQVGKSVWDVRKIENLTTSDRRISREDADKLNQLIENEFDWNQKDFWIS